MTTKYILMHIGKTGGTFLRNYISKYKIKKIIIGRHKSRIVSNNNNKYIIFIRCPINRMVSGFFSRYRVFEDKNKINLLSKNEIKSFNLFEKKYNKNLSLLIEKLYTDNEVMFIFNSISHIYMDINYYLEGIDNVIKNINKIFFIGRMEYLNSDFKKILGLFNYNFINDKKIYNHNTDKYNKYKKLSNKAINNLIKFYEKDYNIIDFLYKNNFIDKEYYKYIFRFIGDL